MKSVIINLDKDTERLVESLDILASFGIFPERIPGVVSEQSWEGFSMAMISALEAIKNEEMAIIFEDDVLLKSWDIPELPDNFDMVYLGANLTKKTDRINKDFVKVNGAWTTHAIIYSKKGVEEILNQYDLSHGIYDEWLRTSFNKNNNCYMLTPMIAYQRECYSNIQDKNVSYTDAMIENYNKFVR